MNDAGERHAWIRLASVSGVAEGYLGVLIARFGSATDVLGRASDGSLRRWASGPSREEGRPRLPERVVSGIENAAIASDEKLERIRQLGLWSLTPLDADYPQRLRDLDPPPAVIHGWGDAAALAHSRAVALVGTRRPTPAGRGLAARLCRRLVECGAAVVSGLAVGIDGVAHAATLDESGCTIAVIGAGHSFPGPRAHADLRRRIASSGGAVISEHHPDVAASRGTYPRRNRIIAALADAALVVEAPRRSGALITARHALELGRTVLVAPGRVGDWSTAGALALLRETPARPLVGLDEMVADLGYFRAPEGAQTRTVTVSRHGALATLGQSERLVAEQICRSPQGLDVLVARTGLPPATVSGAVTLLLMRGWIQAVGPAYLPSGPLLA